MRGERKKKKSFPKSLVCSSVKLLITAQTIIGPVIFIWLPVREISGSHPFPHCEQITDCFQYSRGNRAMTWPQPFHSCWFDFCPVAVYLHNTISVGSPTGAEGGVRTKRSRENSLGFNNIGISAAGTLLLMRSWWLRMMSSFTDTLLQGGSVYRHFGAVCDGSGEMRLCDCAVMHCQVGRVLLCGCIATE